MNRGGAERGADGFGQHCEWGLFRSSEKKVPMRLAVDQKEEPEPWVLLGGTASVLIGFGMPRLPAPRSGE